MGEPLTHPQIAEFISLGKEKGFKIAVTTNGTLLDQRGEEIVKAGVYKVNVSVHSFEDGSVEQYKKYINSCIAFADVASKSGVLTVLRLWNNGFDGGRNIDIAEMLKAYFTEEWHYGKRGARIRDKLHLEYGERFEWPDMQADDRGDSVFCYGLKDHFGILCDGTVVPCCLDREGAIALGNIFESSVEEILSCKRATDMAEGFKNKKACEELCRKCGYARRFKV
jgi:radical SAM protein with 4Fe4S-binding SPASM domain